ncbi:MAG: hypothetical protein JNK53_05870, partial [Phycisphaerae bacterium]|nr:hypothetical protein [Phycisphaerae bacterium]
MITLRSTVVVSCAAACVLVSALTAQQSTDTAPRPPKAYDSPWPQSVTKDGIVYTVDRPSFTTLQGNQVQMEAPLQVTMSDGSMMSGRMTVNASLAPADQAGEVELNRMSIAGADLDGVDDTSSVVSAMGSLLQKAALTVSREVIVKDMDMDPVTTPGLRHEPPAIKVVKTPTVMLAIDGPPHSIALAQTGWRSVTNTPFIVLLDPASHWWLRLGASDWRSASTINGPWNPQPAPPQNVIAALGNPPQAPEGAQANAQAADQSRAATKAAAPTTPPAVFVATEPTVLISLNGEPKLAPLCDGVQAASNTDSVLLRTADPDRWWTLASGRWFAAQNLNGPWGYVAPPALPASFANLPATGQYGGALASVPNTTQAKEAVLANAEMRTVTIDRAQAKCDVKYQGQAQLAPIAGTALSYVTNSNQPVVKVDQAYYCCESAAWFTAPAPTGPWTLCDKVPEAVYSIPASCPIFACTFVEVLGSTDMTVSFGFTPGYV